MKQILQTIAILITLNFSLSAQDIPSIAPDFTVEDINGESHNLYDILGSGKTVILDFYTTWCAPCWNYHNGKELSKMWERHGPDGFDDYVIIGIESDVFTDLDDIKGTGDDTLGDWTEDVSYPMVDNDQIQDIFNIPSYPTYLQICTDRSVVEMTRNFQDPNSPYVEDYEAERLECPVPVIANNLTAYAYIGTEEDICDATTIQPSVDVRNSGTNILTSFIAQLYINNTLEEEIMWDGQLNSYQHTDVVFGNVEVDKETKIEITLSEPNGLTDSDLMDNTVEERLAVAKTSNASELQLEIKTDFRASETYWAILDQNENVVQEGGNVLVGLENIGNVNSIAPAHSSAYNNESNIVETINLVDNGCYTLVVTDFSSNGMCCTWGVGRYVLKDSNGFVLAVGGQFQDKISHNFRYEGGVSSVTTDLLDAEIKIWPNPVNDVLKISLASSKSLELQVYLTDIYGKTIHQFNGIPDSASLDLKYDMSTYPDGIYFVSIVSKDGILSEKIIKN